MEFHAINNEDHRFVVIHMQLELLMLLLNYFLMRLVLLPIDYHLRIVQLDNIPLKKKYIFEK
jgi:hypothetical protein